MKSGPTDYPSNWPGARNQPAAPATPCEAVALAVDAYVSSLSEPDFQALVARTRG
jgi:hypothetical protein